MSLSLNEIFIKKFVTDSDVEAMASEIYSANQLVRTKTGEGSDFLGWCDLPVNYDKEEFARIKVAAEKIKKSCDIFIVIGIGGSYLGARARSEERV